MLISNAVPKGTNPLSDKDLPKVLERIQQAQVGSPEDLEQLREQVAKEYGSYGIPLPVQQALNNIEKTLNETPPNESTKPASGHKPWVKYSPSMTRKQVPENLNTASVTSAPPGPEALPRLLLQIQMLPSLASIESTRATFEHQYKGYGTPQPLLQALNTREQELRKPWSQRTDEVMDLIRNIGR